MEGYDTLHDLLVKLFNEIMNIEEKAIITEEFKDISNNDMHIIEAIAACHLWQRICLSLWER